MIHPAKNPQPDGFDLATFAPSMDGDAGESLGEFLSNFEDQMCDECDSGISESELMDRLKEALDERDRLSWIVDNLKKSIDHPVQCPTCKHHFLPYIDPANLR